MASTMGVEDGFVVEPIKHARDASSGRFRVKVPFSFLRSVLSLSDRLRIVANGNLAKEATAWTIGRVFQPHKG